MTTTAAPTRYTPADVARLSDQTGKLYELVGGTLVEKGSATTEARMSTLANGVALELAYRLRQAYGRDRAHVFLEQPTYCFRDAGQMRRPDVALVWAPRLPNGLTDDELHVVPDFVAEIVSPSNTHDVLHDRIEEFLAAGLPLGMIVTPKHRFVHVYRQDGSGKLYRATDTIADEPALPGLRLTVGEIFPPFGIPKSA